MDVLVRLNIKSVNGCSCDITWIKCVRMDVLVMLDIKSVGMDVLVRLNIKSVGMDVLVRLNKECGHGCSCERVWAWMFL